MSSMSAKAGVRVFVTVIAEAASRFEMYADWLAPDEREVYARIAIESVADEYLVARALSRWALSQQVPDVEPARWVFERTELGRPFVALASLPRPSGTAHEAPNFNLSHAGGLVVCALSSEPVGVDVEPLSRGVELLRMGSHIFSAEETATLAALADDARARRAVALWTVKEAYLKARGEGIALRLSRLSVEASASAARLVDVRALGDEPSHWQIDLRPWSTPEPSFLAVAVRRASVEDVPIDVTLVVPS